MKNNKDIATGSKETFKDRAIESISNHYYIPVISSKKRESGLH
jgi:hypothetical protein